MPPAYDMNVNKEQTEVFERPITVKGRLSAVSIATSITTGITASATETQAAGTQLKSRYNVVSTSGATDAVTLAFLQPGEEQIIKNATAVAIQIFPAPDQKINGGTLNAVDAVNMIAGSTRLYVGAEDGINVISFVWNVPV